MLYAFFWVVLNGLMVRIFVLIRCIWRENFVSDQVDLGSLYFYIRALSLEGAFLLSLDGWGTIKSISSLSRLCSNRQ